MTTEDAPEPAVSPAAALRLQHFTQNEARALRSMYGYYRSDDDDASTSVVCLAVINDLARDNRERSCMRRALEEFQTQSLPEPSESASFLLVLDNGRKKILAETQGSEDGQKYHFLRLLHEYQGRCNAEGKYLLAKEFLEHEAAIRKELTDEQVDSVKEKHLRDGSKMAAAHSRQLEEFREMWDAFLEDFERKSKNCVQELERTHQQQLESLRQSVTNSFDTKPKKWSRDLIQYRKRQMLMADQQRYQEAQRVKAVSDALEEQELLNMNSSLESSLQTRTRTLRKQHRAEMDVLTKRIDGKRKEYAKRMETDCAKLVQRNKNTQTSLDSKHASECLTLVSKIERHVKSLMKEMES